MRKGKLYDVHGEWMTLAEASERYGIIKQTLFMRMQQRGCTLEQAVDMGRRAPMRYPDDRGKKHLINGEMLTARQAAKRLGVSRHTLQERMRVRKCTLQEAVDLGFRAPKPHRQAARYPVEGAMLSIPEAAAKYGVKLKTVEGRIRRGLTLQEAVLQPVRVGREPVYPTVEVDGEQLSVNQAAKRIHASHDSVRKWIADGTFEQRCRDRGVDAQRHRRPTPHEQKMLEAARAIERAANDDIMAILGFC